MATDQTNISRLYNSFAKIIRHDSVNGCFQEGPNLDLQRSNRSLMALDHHGTLPRVNLRTARHGCALGVLGRPLNYYHQHRIMAFITPAPGMCAASNFQAAVNRLTIHRFDEVACRSGAGPIEETMV
jgi:hypothetical protein